MKSNEEQLDVVELEQFEEPWETSIEESASENVGRDLLGALVQEIKLLPDVWPKLSEEKQNRVIDRLRLRVSSAVSKAVQTLSADGRVVVSGSLAQITIKDGVKAVIEFSSFAPNLHHLYDAAGKAVLIVVANPEDHLAGMDEVRGESDQRAIELGHEYAEVDA